MADDLLQKTPLTPREEDHALFAYPLRQCEVALIPKYHINEKNERVIHGILPGNSQVEVLFAGRRTGLADPLIDRLRYLWEHAKSQRPYFDVAAPEEVRLRTAIYGSWRHRFDQDTDGWQTKRYQLVAAIWRIRDKTGRPITRGSAPMLKKNSGMPH